MCFCLFIFEHFRSKSLNAQANLAGIALMSDGGAAKKYGAADINCNEREMQVALPAAQDADEPAEVVGRLGYGRFHRHIILTITSIYQPMSYSESSKTAPKMI